MSAQGKKGEKSIENLNKLKKDSVSVEHNKHADSTDKLEKNPGFKCMRNPGDGSIYYGEVAYIKN